MLPVDLTSASTLYVLSNTRGTLFLTPDSTGIPTVIRPQPAVVRVAFVGYDTDFGSIQRSVGDLQREPANMFFAALNCLDGPPCRSGLIFTHAQTQAVSWRDGSDSRHGTQMERYEAVTARVQYSWLTGLALGRYGYFLTGESGTDSLWKLFRLETEASGKSLFTFAPVRFVSSMPQPDFSSLNDSVARKEAIDQYQDLCRSIVGHNYRDVVTKARNITELILAERLGNKKQLNDNLKAVSAEVYANDPHARLSPLEYHLAQKIRLVHGQTHGTQPVRSGRQLAPEFALTVGEDLVELLRSWGYCQK